MQERKKDEIVFEFLELVKSFSEDPSTKMGACIVTVDNKVVYGYNRAPKGFLDMPWDREADDPLKTKYPFVVHAERDAVARAAKKGINLEGATIYISNFPCNECALEIVNFGISEVVYINDNYRDKTFTKAAKIILEKAGVKCRQYN